ncbi:MAG TPA: protein-export chaperone SecB [Caulobacteraceae bacterium]|jgi:preprotein translocase subunit SecB|nr:protein-export chaperone SecB [Caulobacteraceae bacterium]
MTDVDAGTDLTPPPAPQLRVLAQFTRDLSFENPRAPDSMRMADGQPNVELGVEMSARGRSDGLFEVDLKLSVKASREDQVHFQVELVYGGLFEISGVPSEMLESSLLTECPRYLFPFARRIIADLIVDGGFPPFLLEPLDFGAIYASRQNQQEGLIRTPDGQTFGNA